MGFPEPANIHSPLMLLEFMAADEGQWTRIYICPSLCVECRPPEPAPPRIICGLLNGQEAEVSGHRID